MGLTMVMDKQQNIGVIIGWAIGAIAIVWAIYIIISLIIDYNKDKKKVEELVKEKQVNNASQNNIHQQGNNQNVNGLSQSNMYLPNNNTNMNSQCFLNLDVDSVMNQEEQQSIGYEMQPMNMQPAYAASYTPSGSMVQYSNDMCMPYSQGFYATSNHFTDTGRSGLIGEYTSMESNCGNFVIIKSVISTETREELDFI